MPIKTPIKKPIKKVDGHKPIKPKSSGADEVDNAEIEELVESIQANPNPVTDEADQLLEQDQTQPEQEEEASQLEHKSEQEEQKSDAQMPIHPLANKPETNMVVATTVPDESEEKKRRWLEKLQKIMPKQKTGFTETEGVMTVVNDRNSKRSKLKNVVLEGLGYPDYIKFYVTDEEFVVQASTADEEGSYKLRLEGKRKCLIYNSELIELLSEMFELDFSKSTSQTFGEVKFECIDGVDYAVIYKEV